MAQRRLALTIAARQLYEQNSEWQKRWDDLLPAIREMWIDRIKGVVEAYEHALGTQQSVA